MSKQRYVMLAFIVGAVLVGLTLQSAIVSAVAQFGWSDNRLFGLVNSSTALAVLGGALTFGILIRTKAAVQFSSEVVGQLLQVTWPSREETVRAATTVVVTTLFTAGLLAVYDFGLEEPGRPPSFSRTAKRLPPIGRRDGLWPTERLSMRWYAVNTLSGSEDKAMRALEQRIQQYGLEGRFGRVLVPSETVVDPKTKRKVTRRFYPGYMLVEMELDNETFHLVTNTPKVTGFVGRTRNPPPVPDSEVARITSMLDEEDEPKPVLDFEVGEEVRLTEGRYASMRGTIEEVNEARGKLRVVINMFGRPVPTELSFHQVEKLS